jgi:hypothetical protein
MALHDWTTHSMVNLTDNKLLLHLHNQMAEAVNFRKFVLANPKKFPRIYAGADSKGSFLDQLTENYALYLDNMMAAPNMLHDPTFGVFNERAVTATLTPAELFDDFITKSRRGGGPDYGSLKEQWGDAISAYKRQRTPPPETSYNLTVENIRAGVRKKLGKAAK